MFCDRSCVLIRQKEKNRSSPTFRLRCRSRMRLRKLLAASASVLSPCLRSETRKGASRCFAGRQAGDALLSHPPCLLLARSRVPCRARLFRVRAATRPARLPFRSFRLSCVRVTRQAPRLNTDVGLAKSCRHEYLSLLLLTNSRLVWTCVCRTHLAHLVRPDSLFSVASR